MVLSLSLERMRSREDGDEWAFSLVDNRIRLRWAVVFGQWNMEEEVSQLSSPPAQQTSALDEYKGGEVGFDQGVDFIGGIESEMGSPRPLIPVSKKKRQFRHIHPAHWRSQISTHTSQPKTCAEILQEAMLGAKGGGVLGLSLHTSLQKPSFEVDANSGMSLAALIQQIADSQGLVVGLSGHNTLDFVRPGGTIVIPPGAHLRRDGNTISSEPTKVRVVGGDRLIQEGSGIMMLPDWAPGLEDYFSEHDWLAEVASRMDDEGPWDKGTPAYYAEVAARARSMTLQEYVDGIADNVLPSKEQCTDNAYWNGIPRMQMPVWVYRNEIIWKAYSLYDRFKRAGEIYQNRHFYGVPYEQLEIHPGLLCDMEIDAYRQGVDFSTKDDRFYPNREAFIIVQGQDIDLADSFAKNPDFHYTEDEWLKYSEASEYTIDAKNLTVYFNRPTFNVLRSKLFKYPNREGGNHDGAPLYGIPVGSPFLDIIVPNPNCELYEAEPQAVFTFKAGIFYKDFGSGARWSTHHAPAIAEHLITAGSESETAPSGYLCVTMAIPDCLNHHQRDFTRSFMRAGKPRASWRRTPSMA